MGLIMEEKDIAIQISGLKKRYRLGVIGGGTLQGDIQSWWARKRGKEDPNSVVGSKQHQKNATFMALDGIDLTVEKGQRLGIIGHNGAGKSTLLKLLSRVTAPTEGKICIDGRISSMLEVGTGFNGELTGRENIYLNGAILGMTKAEVDAKMDQIIAFSECGQFIDTPVKRYSSGMYVKLAFSVAAHLDSEILIMDEVLAVGDVAFQKKCLNKMSEVSQSEGRTILYVSHNMSTIRQLCEKCIVMSHGKIIYSGDVEEAINIYLQAESIESPYIEYKNFPEMNRLKNPKVKIESARFIDKDDILFDRNSDKLPIEINWENREDIQDMSLRVEILKFDRTPIAASIYPDFYSGKKGEKGSIKFMLEMPNLVTGKYTTNFTFFHKLSNGSHVNIEVVHGLYFNIVQGPEPIDWQSRYFGNILLPELEVID